MSLCCIAGRHSFMCPADRFFQAGKKTDVWSLGCILYYMTYGVTPFQHITTLVPKVVAINNPSHAIEYKSVGETNLIQTIQVRPNYILQVAYCSLNVCVRACVSLWSLLYTLTRLITFCAWNDIKKCKFAYCFEFIFNYYFFMSTLLCICFCIKYYLFSV